MATSARPRVLVVDDDPGLRGWTMLELRALGVRVAGAANGAEALTAIAEWPPDLVLLDLAMPVLDGPALIDRLRRTRPDLPIVVISRPERAMAAYEAYGLAGYLGKPFSGQRLRDCVREHPERARPARRVIERGGGDVAPAHPGARARAGRPLPRCPCDRDRDRPRA